MAQDQQKINLLAKRLNTLISKQEAFSDEIKKLKDEIEQLTSDNAFEPDQRGQVSKTDIISDTPIDEVKKEVGISKPIPEHQAKVVSKKKISFPIKNDLEKFIGENLISKIGIAITIIGVSIGVKYSIDNELITPLLRVISGYVTGIVLLIIGARLKNNYEQYSAVLVSGAMAIMYFITYVAYSFYGLMPLSIAFGAMVLFTVFVVLISVSYDQQIISLIGLVGAYGVPFLLSDEPGDIIILLSYVSIINVGILSLAFIKYWKLLYYSSFLLSWAIFYFWYIVDFNVEEHFTIVLIFSLIFFFTFYITFLAYKLFKNESFKTYDIVFIMLNSFIFYGIGYMTLDEHEVGKNNLGLFTIINGVIHLIVSVIVLRQKQSDRNLFLLIIGLFIVFLTISIPVQLDGKWVTLLWIGEATILFWIGKVKVTQVYQYLSYTLIFLAFMSLLQDWSIYYKVIEPLDHEAMITPVLNIQFFSSFIFIACLGYINYIFHDKKYPTIQKTDSIQEIAQYAIPTLFLLTVYLSNRYEITHYWDRLFALSAFEPDSIVLDSENIVRNHDLPKFKTVWLVNYSVIYFIVLSVVNMIWIKNSKLGLINLIFNGVVVYVFLLLALFEISELRENYLFQTNAAYYEIGVYHILIRYISIVLVVILIIAGYKYIQQDFINQNLDLIYGIFTHITILWLLSSELIHWLDMIGIEETYKLGISILWGLYSLFMIVLGIWKKKKYLRIMAIGIFAITLIKLFFYDVSELETIPKTILFVSLGILLLIISFLYNKYKHFIDE